MDYLKVKFSIWNFQSEWVPSNQSKYDQNDVISLTDGHPQCFIKRMSQQAVSVSTSPTQK